MIKSEFYKSLLFPLNVYSFGYFRETGQLNHLHFGFFENADDSASDAVQRSGDWLISRLPPPPCSILDVGCGFGTTMNQLQAKGYSVTGINPDANQIKITRDLYTTDLKIIQTDFESAQLPHESFDIILFQESSQYINDLKLLNKANYLLRTGGKILIVDEMVNHPPMDEVEYLHNFSYFKALAKRVGFEIIAEENLTDRAAPTMDYLLSILTKYKNEILQELPVNSTQFDNLQNSVKKYISKYRNGTYGYFFLELMKKEKPKWEIREMTPEDEPALRELFRLVFGHEISTEFWNWKYHNNRGRAVIALKDGKPVGHYGGFTRTASIRGREFFAVQPGDSMVHPAERYLRGPFFITAATFLEKWTGHGTGHRVGYGFPSLKAEKLGKLLKLYFETDSLSELQWTPCDTNNLQFKCFRITGKPGLKITDKIWDSVSNSFSESIIIKRDAEYLHYRYFEHPEFKYQMYAVTNRFFSGNAGWFVVKSEDRVCKLMDFLCPEKMMPALISHVLKIARNNNCEIITAWITNSHLHWFSRTNPEVRDSGIRVAADLWTRSGPDENYQNNWWLTYGDTDFM